MFSLTIGGSMIGMKKQLALLNILLLTNKDFEYFLLP
jgi:hypothetical protein